MEKSKKLGLQVNNDVKKSLYRTMRAKRILSWISLIVTIAMVISPFLFFKFHWPGAEVLYFMLPVSVVFLVVSIYTFTGSRSVVQALQNDNQAAFDDAMSKWNLRSVVASVGYIFYYLMAVVMLILMILVILVDTETI